MANPVTSIINPKGNEILLFYVDGKQRLALDHIPANPKGTVQHYKSPETPSGGLVPNQSIAAVYLHGVPAVFGQLQVIKGSGESQTKKRLLAQLSPVVKVFVDSENPEDTIFDDNYNAFAAISNNDQDHVWCYKLKKTTQGETVKLGLEEISIVGNDVEINHFTEIPDNLLPDPTTRLAALYVDQSHREVYFQKRGASKHIFCYTIGSGNPPSEIPGTQSAMKGTPITVTTSKTGNIYLYFLDKPEEKNHGVIHRATRTKDGWKQSAVAMSETLPHTRVETQLTVTQVTWNEKSQNAVFSIRESGSRYEPSRDEGNFE